MIRFSNKITLVAVVLAIFIFCLDALTKYLVVENIPLAASSSFQYPYGGIGIFENFLGTEFSLNHVVNRGAAWGAFKEYHSILITLRIILVLGIIVYLIYFNKNKKWEIPFALILAGAIGNILDIYLYGHVIDMFHFVFWGYDYPVFNVADSAIFIGICWLVLSAWFPKSKLLNP